MSSYIDRRFMEVGQSSVTPARGSASNANSELEINVIFTDEQGTLAALNTGKTLAQQLCAHINLIVPQVVPYPFSLNSPPVSIQFMERRLLVLAHRGAQGSFDTFVQLYLCRDRQLCLSQALKPRSLVLLGGRAGWWPTKETKLMRMLRLAGHEVIFVDLK